MFWVSLQLVVVDHRLSLQTQADLNVQFVLKTTENLSLIENRRQLICFSIRGKMETLEEMVTLKGIKGPEKLTPAQANPLIPTLQPVFIPERRKSGNVSVWNKRSQKQHGQTLRRWRYGTCFLLSSTLPKSVTSQINSSSVIFKAGLWTAAGQK